MTWTPISKAGVLDDEVMPVSVGGHEVALYQVNDEYFATSNVCTHAYALLSDGYCEAGQVECLLYAANFDIRTGAAPRARACEALRVFPVKVAGDDVLLEH